MNENMRIAGDLADLAREIIASGNEYKDISRGLSSLSKSFRNQGGRFTKSPDKDFSKTVSKGLGDLGKSFGKIRKSGLTERQASLIREARRVLRMASEETDSEEKNVLKVSKGNKVNKENYSGIVEYCQGGLEKNFTAEKANFKINEKGMIDWYSGVWKNGVWLGGDWHGGTWESGVWRDGTWENGDWNYGGWMNGTFAGGTWHDGVWEGGTWEKGIWKTGTDKKNKKHDDAPNLWETESEVTPEAPESQEPAELESPEPVSTDDSSSEVDDDSKLIERALKDLGEFDGQGKKVKKYSDKLQEKINKRKEALEQKKKEKEKEFEKCRALYKKLKDSLKGEKEKENGGDKDTIAELKKNLRAILGYSGKIKEQLKKTQDQLDSNEKYFKKLSEVKKKFEENGGMNRKNSRKSNGGKKEEKRSDNPLVQKANDYWSRFADDEGDDFAGSCRVDDVSVAKELTKVASMLLADEKEEKSSMSELTTELKSDLKSFNSVGSKKIKMLDKDAPSTPFNKMTVKEVLDALNDMKKD